MPTLTTEEHCKDCGKHTDDVGELYHGKCANCIYRDEQRADNLWEYNRES